MCETQCCCTGGRRYHRRHLTNAEHKEQLQLYADDLAKELQAVNERIEALP
jgi:hypothetical protein